MSTWGSTYWRRSRVRLHCSLCPCPTTTLHLSTVMGSLRTFMIYICFCAKPISDWCVSPAVPPLSGSLLQQWWGLWLFWFGGASVDILGCAWPSALIVALASCKIDYTKVHESHCCNKATGTGWGFARENLAGLSPASSTMANDDSATPSPAWLGSNTMPQPTTTR
jgi:hypothetical protein